LKSVAAKAVALVAFSLLAWLPLTILTVSAAANPNNHGHHYGQLKHQPPPVPPPQPPPPPAPKSNPPSGATIVSHANTAIAPVIAPPVAGGELPLPPSGGPGAAPQRAPAAGPPFRDPNLWIVEALLPVLAIVWLIVLAASLQRATRAAKEQPG
jgi:hypothetical protein